ncbi:MAG: hypothetical protein LC772_00145, partial [Chloroflexi bacterium]|nr:hypothetical protein [Chloroflexota bacterium]
PSDGYLQCPAVEPPVLALIPSRTRVPPSRKNLGEGSLILSVAVPEKLWLAPCFPRPEDHWPQALETGVSMP